MNNSPSAKWSDAQLAVNEALSALLNTLRDLGLNPNHHVSYDSNEHLLVVDEDVLTKYPAATVAYESYATACQRRDEAVEEIQAMPKRDLGF